MWLHFNLYDFFLFPTKYVFSIADHLLTHSRQFTPMFVQFRNQPSAFNYRSITWIIDPHFNFNARFLMWIFTKIQMLLCVAKKQQRLGCFTSISSLRFSSWRFNEQLLSMFHIHFFGSNDSGWFQFTQYLFTISVQFAIFKG